MSMITTFESTTTPALRRSAVVLVARGDPTSHIHMLIATALGIGLTMLLGTGLMTLAFLSSSSGHDEQASHFHQEND